MVPALLRRMKKENKQSSYLSSVWCYFGVNIHRQWNCGKQAKMVLTMLRVPSQRTFSLTGQPISFLTLS